MQDRECILLEILLPVHNEAGSIEATIHELYTELASQLSLRLIVCEDGSKDGTQEVLRRLSRTVPMKLIMSDHRKGYSRAMVDGMGVSGAPYLFCMDADGQLDPKDFWRFWNVRNNHDVTVGWRVHRADPSLRLILSRAFYHLYQCFYHVPVHDPSCPFLLLNRRVVEAINGDMGSMKEGFWWEFVARAYRRGFSIQELPINHRHRIAGVTQVYLPKKLLSIGWRHVVALFTIWRQTRP